MQVRQNGVVDCGDGPANIFLHFICPKRTILRGLTVCRPDTKRARKVLVRTCLIAPGLRKVKRFLIGHVQMCCALLPVTYPAQVYGRLTLKPRSVQKLLAWLGRRTLATGA